MLTAETHELLLLLIPAGVSPHTSGSGCGRPERETSQNTQVPLLLHPARGPASSSASRRCLRFAVSWRGKCELLKTKADGVRGFPGGGRFSSKRQDSVHLVAAWGAAPIGTMPQYRDQAQGLRWELFPGEGPAEPLRLGESPRPRGQEGAPPAGT